LKHDKFVFTSDTFVIGLPFNAVPKHGKEYGMSGPLQ